MSLINDALKQAKKTEPKAPAPVAGLTLSPVDTARRAGGNDMLMVALATVILLLAGLLLWQWFRGDAGIVKVRANTLPLTITPAAPPAPIVKAAPAPAPVTPPAIPTVAPIAPALATPIVTPPPAAPAPPTYKLQSIFYFAKNPSAMINGKTVNVGNRINGARVIAITKESATLQTPTGQTILLELP